MFVQTIFSRTKKGVVCGVPQGSVIGPTLFLIYVNDIVNLNLQSKSLLFADDTVIYYSGKDKEQVKTQILKDLDILTQWCYYNKLSVNVSKTKCMVFGNGFTACNTEVDNISLCGSVIETVQTYEYLGVMIDANVTFKDHLSKIVRNVNNKLYLLSILRKQITVQCAVLLYKSMILPYFEYGDVFLSACTVTDLSKLQILQNRGLRIVFKRNSYSSVNQLHIDANILPLSYRQKISVIKLMFDMKCNSELLDVRDLSTR